MVTTFIRPGMRGTSVCLRTLGLVLALVAAVQTSAKGTASSGNAFGNAPTVTLDPTEGPLRIWTFSGTVTDESVTTCTVKLGGIPSLSGKTATPNSSGGYSLSVQLGEDEEGTAWAQAYDNEGLSSSKVYATVHQTP